MKVDVAKLTAANATRWHAMRVNPARISEIDKVVTRLWTPATKARYDVIQSATGVPDIFQALAHERESSGNFERSLAQGDPLNRRSVDVPKGRIPPPAEPPFTFEAAAIDGLVACDHVDQWKDWSIPGLLSKEELWNGAGYWLHGLASPYVWAGSDQYTHAKYTGDGVLSLSAVDQQLGVAVMFARIMAIDPEIAARFAADMPTAADHPALVVPAAPSPPEHDNVTLQTMLNRLGAVEPWRTGILDALADLNPPGTLPLATDGDYGTLTKQAVRGFQREHGGLLDDGRAGVTTWPAIVQAVAELP